MRNIRANESKVFGALFILAFVLLVAVTVVTGDAEVWEYLGAAIIGLFILAYAYYGIRAQPVYLDEDEIVFERAKGKLERFEFSEICSARTIPYFKGLDVIFLRTEKGVKASTIVRQIDTGYVMGRFPLSSLTPYWARRRG